MLLPKANTLNSWGPFYYLHSHSGQPGSRRAPASSSPRPAAAAPQRGRWVEAQRRTLRATSGRPAGCLERLGGSSQFLPRRAAAGRTWTSRSAVRGPTSFLRSGEQRGACSGSSGAGAMCSKGHKKIVQSAFLRSYTLKKAPPPLIYTPQAFKGKPSLESINVQYTSWRRAGI